MRLDFRVNNNQIAMGKRWRREPDHQSDLQEGNIMDNLNFRIFSVQLQSLELKIGL